MKEKENVKEQRQANKKKVLVLKKEQVALNPMRL